MPRQARLDVPGALHHLMVRGINKSDIFQRPNASRFYCMKRRDSIRHLHPWLRVAQLESMTYVY
jgi:hypothetical protein